MYEKSKSLAEQGYDIPASMFYDHLSRIIYPAPYINYNSLRDVNNFFSNLTEKVYSEFPFLITLPSFDDVVIYRLSMDIVSTGFMPIISYTTGIELKEENVDELKQQAFAIHEELKELFPGFSETFDYFIYSSYSEAPVDPNKQYMYHNELVDETANNN